MVLPDINPSSYIPCYISKENYYYYHHSCPISLFLYHFDFYHFPGLADTSNLPIHKNTMSRHKSFMTLVHSD